MSLSAKNLAGSTKHSRLREGGSALAAVCQGQAEMGEESACWWSSNVKHCIPTLSRTDRLGRGRMLHMQTYSVGTRHGRDGDGQDGYSTWNMALTM